MIELLDKEHLNAFILRLENIEALEDSLNRNCLELSSIERVKEQLPLRRELDESGIVGLFHDVTYETRGILNLSNSQVGRINIAIFDWRHVAKSGVVVSGGLVAFGLAASAFSGGITPDMILKAAAVFAGIEVLTVAHRYVDFPMYSYNPASRLVAVRDKREHKVADLITETYDRYILFDKTVGILGTPVGEGHILGMRKSVGRILAHKHDNDAFLYEPLKNFTGALKDVYLYTCATKGKTPRKSLVEIDVPTTPSNYIPALRLKPLHNKWVLPGNIGVAVLAIAEEKSGSNVYGQVAQEDFSFLI